MHSSRRRCGELQALDSNGATGLSPTLGNTTVYQMNRSAGATPTLSSIVNTCGGIPFGHLRDLVRQLEALSDEVILFVDDIAPADFLAEARLLCRDTRTLKHRDSPQQFVAEMLAQCGCDFILRLNHDELLSPNWTRAFLDFVMADRRVNSYWIARKWLVDKQGRYISSPPHFPDYQARLTRNLPSIVRAPVLLHDATLVDGDHGWISSHVLLHYDLVWASRVEREAKVQRYKTIRPEHSCAEYYLYEDREHTVSEPDEAGPLAGQVWLLDQPESMVAGREYSLRLVLHNTNGRVWTSQATPPVRIAYHWFTEDEPDREALVWNGSRTELRAGEGLSQCVVQVRAPDRPGRYLLQIDLVEEGVAWFSEAALRKSAFPLYPIKVQAAPAPESGDGPVRA